MLLQITDILGTFKARNLVKSGSKLKAGHFTIKVGEKRKNVTKSEKDWSVR